MACAAAVEPVARVVHAEPSQCRTAAEAIHTSVWEAAQMPSTSVLPGDATDFHDPFHAATGDGDAPPRPATQISPPVTEAANTLSIGAVAAVNRVPSQWAYWRPSPKTNTSFGDR